MINIENSAVQSIGISSVINPQRIVVKNIDEQNITITEKYENRDIEIRQECPQKISISMTCPCKVDVAIAIESKVPKDLSFLSKAADSAFNTIIAREKSLIYVDIDGSASYTTLEQIKQLGTKVLLVDDLEDSKIEKLSYGDFVALKER